MQNSESSACVQAERGLWEEPCNVLTPGRQSTTSWQGGFLDRNQITMQVLHFVMLGFSAVAMCHIFSRDNAYLPIISLKYPSQKSSFARHDLQPPEGHNQFLIDFSTDKISLSDRNKSLNKNKVSHKQLQCFPSTQYLAASEALTLLAQ